MKLYRIVLVLLTILINVLWASSFPVRLLSERHRTEKNWVEYRLFLKNLSNSSLVNPTIRYFAENPRIQYCRANPNDTKCEGAQFNDFGVDSTLKAVVDYHSIVRSVDTSFYYGSDYTVISLKFNGFIPAHATSVVHLRIMKKKYPDWDCSNDYSYQTKTASQENYKMAVYDGNGNILWGNDPVALKHDTTNVYWHDRAGTTVVSRYDGTDSAKVLNGRFWLLKEKSLTDDERISLNKIGVNVFETSRYQNKGLHLLKTVVPVKKKKIDSALSEFYNVFAVDDSTRIPLILYSDDIYEHRKVCDAGDSCTTIVNTLSAIDAVIECWPDISRHACKNVVLDCGGNSVYFDRQVVLAKVHRDSLLCLERHKNLRTIRVRRKGKENNDRGRKAVELNELQDYDVKWKQALQAVNVTTDWLSGADYTGEGVIVGVYDSGFDQEHPALCEVDVDGKNKPRKAGIDGDSWSAVENKDVGDHGTHVAGIIGGNGRMSETYENSNFYQYRGVAPKVKFFFGVQDIYNQRGHIANHSHFVKEEGVYYVDREDSFGNKYKVDIGLAYYGEEHRNLDLNIFTDWKASSDMGDSRSKTIVFAAGNNGKDAQQSPTRGFYSITDDSKNAIVVGSFDPENNELSDFSSLGPTWDGRIKPDVMAPGTRIVSSIPVELGSKYYDVMSGTSMAAPFVSGIAALMYQKFHKQTRESLDNHSMRNSTTKALLIHSAVDMQGCSNENADIATLNRKQKQPKLCTPYTLGPDFATGWGRVNAPGALSLIKNYDFNTKTFANFREFDVYEGAQNQRNWNVFVPEGRKNLRTTLVWDDAPGNGQKNSYMELKLVNDLDLYLVSPTGKIYYPWRLDPLPNQCITIYGTDIDQNEINLRNRTWQKITFDDANIPAYKKCKGEDFTATVDDGCFDRRNNVEVVDVDKPEPGLWQVFVKAYGRVEPGNSLDGKAQIASIVSDFELMDKMYNGEHPYQANAKMWNIIDLDKDYLEHADCLEHYVTFSSETSLGQGDHIYLYDEQDNLIGDYVGNSLANQRIVVKTRFLKLILFSNDDNNQGWGYSISKIEHVPYGVLQVLFPPYKKGD